MVEQINYYRPEWTCGRFNKEKQVALMYNLIEGMSYFFKDYSAEVIGAILSVNKNGRFSIEEISFQTLIDKESLTPFFKELVQLGLLVLNTPTPHSIDLYRKRISKERKEYYSITSVIEQAENEDLYQNLSSAEKDYAEIVGGVTDVMFELTYNCSEKCVHCYNPGATRNDTEINKRGDRVELELEDYKRIIDELYDLGLTKVCLSGGDPFSKSIVWEIIDYLYHKGIATDIFTNGQSIVKDVQLLANYYPKTVSISIYSGVAADHDDITRVKGSWKRSIDVLQQLSDLGVPMNLKCCIMRHNVKSYHMVADMAKQNGAMFQFSISLINSLEGDKCVSHYLLLPSDILELVLRDNKISRYYVKENEQRTKMMQRRCKAYCITPEGDLQLCCSFPSPLGNVKNETITHILHNSKLLAWWNNISPDDYEQCGKYEYCDYCYFCPGNNFSETGSPLKPATTNCEIAKVRFDLAEKIKQGKDPLKGKTVQECLSSLTIHLLELKQEKGQNYRNKKMTAGG